MTENEKVTAAAIVADAANPAIDRENVLGRLTALNRVINGDERLELTGQVHNALDRRPA